MARYIKIIGTATLFILMGSVSVQAQYSHSYDVSNIPHGAFHAGIAFDGAQPTGDFGSKVENGAGFDMWFRWDFNPYFGIGLDWEFINYGNEKVDVCAFSACRIQINTITSNNIWFAGFGPEFALDMGSVRPHLGLKGGFSLFQTSTRVEGDGGGGGGHLADLGFQWHIDSGMDFKLTDRWWLTTG